MEDFNLRKYLKHNPLLKENKEGIVEIFGMFSSHAEKDWKKSIEKVINNFFGGDVPESKDQRKYLEDIWDEANMEYDRQAGDTTAVDVSEIVRKILRGETEMHREGTYGTTIDKVIRVANKIKKLKEKETQLDDYAIREYDQEEQTEIDMENRVGDEMTENVFGHPGRTGFSLGRKPGHERDQTAEEKWNSMHEDEKMTFLHSHIKDPDDADSYLDASIDELPNQVVAAL